MGVDVLTDSRSGTNKRHLLVPLLRQSIYSRLAGYEDVNDAERLCIDPAMINTASQQAVRWCGWANDLTLRNSAQPQRRVAPNSRVHIVTTSSFAESPSVVRQTVGGTGMRIDRSPTPHV